MCMCWVGMNGEKCCKCDDTDVIDPRLERLKNPIKSHQTPEADVTLNNLLNAELYNALDEWFESLDLLMKLNGCILAELIGSEKKDLRRIYKAYQAIKATGI